MKYILNDKVITQNMDGRYNNVSGTIIKLHPDMDIEPVYTVEYDIPFGSCTKGMFKESDLKPKQKEFVHYEDELEDLRECESLYNDGL